MPGPILFYFDFISPYGYLGSVGVEQLAHRLGCGVEWRPVLLGITVLKVMGLKALPDTPLKGSYVHHDTKRLAGFMGIAFNRPPGPMQPLPAMRAFVWLNQRDPALAKRFGQAIYRAHWGEARNMSSPDAVAAVGATLGLHAADVIAGMTDPAVKDQLRADVDAAIAAGVFGVPSFVVGGEMFWGADRLPMLERWIETGGW